MKCLYFLIFSLILNSCLVPNETNDKNVSNKGEVILKNEYEFINEAYLPKSIDTIRPLKLYEHVSKANMITVFRYLQLEKYLIKELNYTNAEIKKLEEAIMADYSQLGGQFADTSFSFNSNKLSKEIVVIRHDSIKKLEPKHYFKLTIISEPIIDYEKNICFLFETFHLTERILIFQMKNNNWSLIKDMKAEHSE